MKKILITNGSQSDTVLIEAAHILGYYVITTGNNPDLPGHKLSDKYINCDYSNYKKILDICKTENIDAICASSNDFGAITASYVAEKMNLQGHDDFNTTLTLHHKDTLRKLLINNDMLTPKAISFDSIEKANEHAKLVDRKVIIKPIDLGGGKGISVSDNYEGIIEGIKHAFDISKNKKIVIEDFIEGTYHSFSTFIVDRKVRYCYSDNEYFHNFLCDISGGPADNIDNVRGILIGQCEKLADILNLVDGRLHVQYVMDKDGNPYPIEYTRRCSGDLYCIPESRALGIDTALNIVRAECGLDVKGVEKKYDQNGYTGRYVILAPQNGKVKDVIIDNELKKYIFDSNMLYDKDGYEIKNHILDRVGVISYDFDDKEKMISTIKNINKYVKVVQ